MVIDDDWKYTMDYAENIKMLKNAEIQDWSGETFRGQTKHHRKHTSLKDYYLKEYILFHLSEISRGHVNRCS